jgi:hypothetical protein
MGHLGREVAVTAEPGPIYVIRLCPERGVDAIKSLRRALKFLLRQCQLRCLSIEEEKDNA